MPRNMPSLWSSRAERCHRTYHQMITYSLLWPYDIADHVCMCAWHRCSGTCARQKPEPVIAWALKLKDRSTCLLTKITYPYLLELLTFAASRLKKYMLSLTSCSLTWTNINITCKLYLIIFLDLFQRWLHYYWSNCRCLPTRGWITRSRGFLRDSTSFVSMSIMVR